MFRVMIRFFVTMLILFFVGCDAQRVSLEPKYSSEVRVLSAMRKRAEKKTSSYRHYVDACVRLKDERAAERGVLTVISTEAVLDWLAEALAIESGGSVKVAENVSQAGLPVIAVKKSYVGYQQWAMIGNVVLLFYSKGQRIIYRGSYFEINASETTREHERVLNGAIKDAATKLISEQFGEGVDYFPCIQ